MNWGIALRRVIRWVTSREGRGYIFRSAAAALLLFPVLVVALDHHGVEHLANHSHPGVLGELPHLHEYQVPHMHTPAALPPSGSSPEIVAAVPAVGVALGLAIDAGLPLLRPLFIGAIMAPWAPIASPTISSQTSLAPRTQPPIAAI